MDRRRFLATLAVTSGAGCLRIADEQNGTNTTSSIGESGDNTMPSESSGDSTPPEQDNEDSPARPTVSGLEKLWDNEDFNLDAIHPDVIRVADDTLWVFGMEGARISLTDLTVANTVQLTPQGATLAGVEEAVLNDNAWYVGTRNPPSILRLDQELSEIQRTVEPSENLESVTTLAVHDGLVFAGARAQPANNQGQFIVLDAATMGRVFEHSWPSQYPDSLAIHDDTVYLGTSGDDPMPYAYSISDQEVFRADQRFGIGRLSNVTVSGGVLYTLSKYLTARNAASHEILAQRGFPTLGQAPPVVHDDQVYAMTSSGVRAFSTGNFTEQWSVRTTDSVVQPPAFGDRIAFITDLSDIIYVIDTATGDILHETNPFELLVSDIKAVGDTLFVAMDGFQALKIERE